MIHDQTYSPVPYAPAPRLRDADGSMRPHTYGVRVCSCTSIATEPCRPTACAGEHPNPSAYTTTANYPLLTANSSYTFSAKERDSETGLSYFGSRYYSSDLSIWLSVDPMSAKYPSLSPYVYCADNPVRLVDPDGEEFWKPDEDGNLIAQRGDNAWTLAKYLNIGAKDACDMLKSQGYKINNGILNLKIGDKFKVDNVYTRSIANSTSDLTRETDLAHTSKTGATPEDHYNCWGAAVAGSQGKEINNAVGIPTGGEFDCQVYSSYSATNLENAKFGKTLIRFADGNNNAQHAAIYYGTSNDGTVYVYTKNGWDYKPAIMKLNDLLQKFPNYGTIQGINSGDSGYYDFSK